MTNILKRSKTGAQAVITGTITAGTKSASGDNTLVTAPATGYRLVVKGWYIQNESATATTILLKDGASSNLYRYLAQNQGDGIGRVYEQGFELRLTAATALILNLSGANSHGYWLEYWTEAV